MNRESQSLSPAAVGDVARPPIALVAPWLFVLLWSTGFIGARFGLPYIEPFTFLAIRFVIAAALLGLIAAAARSPWPRPAQLGHIAVAGLLLHAGYLGGVFFAIDRGMTAGMTALIVSLQPALTALLARRTLGERISERQWSGLALGLLGVCLVVGEKMSGSAALVVTPATLVACLVALVSTTLGTLYQKRHGATMPLLSGTAVQYVAAGALLAPMALLFETRTILWTPQLLFALVWLVLVLSLGAILLLLLLLRLNSASSVASLFYLVPPATAVEAFLLFGERLGTQALVGLAVASFGVALVVTGGQGDKVRG